MKRVPTSHAESRPVPRSRSAPALVAPAADRIAAARTLWLCVLTDAPHDVALVALGWSPRISVDDDAVLVEVGGSRRLLGSLTAVRDAAARWPHALAPTPTAASWLARGAPGTWIESPAELRGALGAVPLAALGLPDALAARLHGFGARRVRDLVRLPRAALARRTDRALLEALDRAFGERPDPRAAWQPPLRFDRRRELDFETGSAETVARLAQPLFAQLAALLRASGRGVRRCTLRLEHADAPPTRLRLGVLEPVRDAARLETQLALQLERVPLVAPVRALSLHASRLERVADGSHDLFAPRASGEGWTALLERLRTRLGADALYRVMPHADHRPERAFRRMESTKSAAPTVPASTFAGRPFWLLPEPRPIDPSAYRLAVGPERIESGWWDGGDVARDYFVARDGRGARCWVFRERREPYGWYLHGFFG